MDVETAFNYCEVGNDKGFFSSNERRWINHIRKLNVKYPNECIILDQPEDNNGYINAKLPTSWLKVGPKKKSNMTEEQRTELAERLKRARNSGD